MTTSIKYLAYPLLLGAAVTLAGCNSGGGNDNGSGKATVPANAITITAANAEATLASAAANGDKAKQAALVTASAPNLKLVEALALVKKLKKTTASSVMTTGMTQTQNCTGGGTMTISSTVSGNTDSGSVKFNNCIEEGITLNGTLSVSETYDPSTTVYSDTASGSLTAAGNDITISFNGFDFAINGNANNMTYTITKYIVALDFTTNGSAGGGFLVELTAPIVESNGDFCPESGAIKITGANNTTAELIYNGNGTATIKANGAVVNPSAPCYS